MSESTSSDPQRDAAAWLAAVVDNSSDAIVSKTLDGIITSWNGGAEKLFGFSAEEAIGQPITIIIPDDRLHEEPEIITKLRAGERVDRFETIRCRKDGSPVTIEVTISPVRDQAGRIIGASKIARDIGERQRFSEQQRLLVREMQHRIKNLLSIVQGLINVGRRRAETLDMFASDLSSRIAALGAAQTLVLQDPQGDLPQVTLGQLLNEVLAPYLEDGMTLPACDTGIGPRALTSLALLFHELATNAVKYGALRDPGGALLIGVKEMDRQLLIDWRERGGLRTDGVQGFGTELLHAALRGLGGSLDQAWEGHERVVTIGLPRDQLAL